MPFAVRVLRVDLPARLELDERKRVRAVAVDLVRRREDERRLGRVQANVASSRLSVPTALMSKSVNGSRAAQSCDGCAAAWMTSSIALP